MGTGQLPRAGWAPVIYDDDETYPVGFFFNWRGLYLVWAESRLNFLLFWISKLIFPLAYWFYFVVFLVVARSNRGVRLLRSCVLVRGGRQ